MTENKEKEIKFSFSTWLNGFSWGLVLAALAFILGDFLGVIG